MCAEHRPLASGRLESPGGQVMVYRRVQIVGKAIFPCLFGVCPYDVGCWSEKFHRDVVAYLLRALHVTAQADFAIGTSSSQCEA